VTAGVCACGRGMRSSKAGACSNCRARPRPDAVEEVTSPRGHKLNGISQRHFYSVQGVMCRIEEIAELAGVSKDAIYQRIRIGTPLLKPRMRKS
jgi:hypothetical protein